MAEPKRTIDHVGVRVKRPADERGVGTQDPSNRIIMAAEEAFAYFGFDATTLREVARRADVPLATVSYAFGGKKGLYRAVFEARVPALVEQRTAGLALSDLETDPDRKLEMILNAVMTPILSLRITERRSHFGTILARELSDPRAVDRGIVRDLADPVATAITTRLAEALPDRSQAEVHWLLQIVIGTLVYVMIDQGRIRELSNRAADPDDIAATIKYISSIVLNGIRV